MLKIVHLCGFLKIPGMLHLLANLFPGSIFIEDSNSQRQFFIPAKAENGVNVYKGCYLGKPAKIEWSAKENRWEMSIFTRRKDVLIFYSGYSSSETLPHHDENSWKSLYDCCELVKIESVRTKKNPAELQLA